MVTRPIGMPSMASRKPSSGTLATTGPIAADAGTRLGSGSSLASPRVRRKRPVSPSTTSITR
jgi:hypothetical protein